jgi:hypothetical protein
VSAPQQIRIRAESEQNQSTEKSVKARLQTLQTPHFAPALHIAAMLRLLCRT